MNIGIDARYAYHPTRTGIGIYARNLLDELFRLDPEGLHYDLYLDGREDAAALPSSPSIGRRVLRFPWNGLWTQARLPWALLRRRPDLLFFSAHSIPILATVPAVVILHDVPTHRAELLRPTDRIRLELLTRHAAIASARILANSEFVKQSILREYRVAPEKVVVTPLACDHRRFHSNHAPERIVRMRERYGLERPYLLFVGRSEPYKNLPRLVHAFALARQQGDLPHQLVVAGPAGTDEGAMRTMIATHRLEPHVRRLDYVSHETDLPLLYAGAAGFVFPSAYEGFGLPVLEAMASGTPVVTSRIAALPEVAGDAAVFCDPTDVHSIAAGIGTLCSDSATAEMLRERGFARASGFTWARTATLTRDVFKSLG